jgi:hypothetical protein
MKKLTFSLDQNCLDSFENSSDYVDVRSLATNVAKSFAKPASARFVRLSAGTLFYYSVSGTASASAVDISNGTGSISVPATVQPTFCVDDVSAISVVAPTNAIVSAEWWA